jgi:hypothetical protein
MGTSSWRTRFMALLAALAMTGGLLTATAGPASAEDQPCSQGEHGLYNACLTIAYAGGSRWNVHAGYDGHMPKRTADDLLACPGGFSIFAELWGWDGGHPYNDHLGYIPLLPGWPRSGENPAGLFAEFGASGMNLNEDSGTDEVYAEITYFDCLYQPDGRWVTAATGILQGNF